MQLLQINRATVMTIGQVGSNDFADEYVMS